ncbi:MAG: thioesterase family protein [Acidimicrobiales bacterium]|nr:thioesterase family protein [Acidimicrobiales bacterium]
MTAPFSSSTDAVPLGDGRYRARIDPAWNLRPIPQGGIVTAIALRAMADELAQPEQRLRSLHTMFCAQVSDGEVEVEVDVLRRGRSMSHLRAEVANPGSGRGHVTTAVFGSERRGFDFTDLEPPAGIIPPDDCPSFRDPLPDGVEDFEEMAFWAQQVEGRSLLGHPPWEDFPPGRAERVYWYRFDDPPFLEHGTLDPLGLVVLADTMPGAVGERVGRQDQAWFAPSVDLTVHVLDTCRSSWVLGHNRARFAGHGYASGDMALWDCGERGEREPRLVAYATQLFLFTFLG